MAFFSLTPKQIDHIRKSETRTNNLIISLLSEPQYLLSTILISNNFVNIGIVLTTSHFIESTLDFSAAPPWLDLLIKVILVTFLLLLFGEIMPKIYASMSPVGFAAIMAYPMFMMKRLSYPLSFVLINSTEIVNKKMAKHKQGISVDDLSHALNITQGSSSEERQMLESIVRFGNIDARNVMKPRVDISAVEINTTFNELLDLVAQWGFSRIPVYEGSFDSMRGILYVKDLLMQLNQQNDYNWQQHIREVFFVPQNIKINQLLHEFQQRKTHMAIVTDEYGGTSGLVTMEDVIEEITGEIKDELDELEFEYTKIDENTFSFEGKTLIHDFCKILQINDSIFDELNAETLAGLVLERKGEIPQKDEEFRIAGFLFVIQEADSRRIKRIKVQRETPAKPGLQKK